MKRKMIRMEVLPAYGDMPWKVTVTGAVVIHSMTQNDGVIWARDYIKERLHAGIAFTLKIKGRDGIIKREHTYPRSSDPRRSKG